MPKLASSTVKKKVTAARRARPAATARDDEAYQAYLSQLRVRFLSAVSGGKPLFTTDAKELFAEYLAHLPASVRQWHNCHACRRFIGRYGHLVIINEQGTTTSALWDAADAPPEVAAGIGRLQQLSNKARVTGVFYSARPVWGEPITGEWRHLAAIPPDERIWTRAAQTAFQGMAEKREDYKNILRALTELPLAAITQAITLLKTDSLYRSEKCLGVAEWLRGLHEMRARVKHKGTRDNLTWLAVATAPAGFCHPRASMIGSLLEDILAGLPFDDVSKKFAAKMNPLRYQRPQAAPSAGNIAAAEKVVAQLAAAGALARRFARLEEVQALWLPHAPKPERVGGVGGGVFAHLQPKGFPPVPEMTRPPVKMTWEKFCKTVLFEAERIEYWVPGHGNFCALVTAVDPAAPPILQWDSAEARNPVSWYVYQMGSPAAQWGLPEHAFVPVTAVAYQPSMWKGDFAHQGKSVLFLLAGAQDTGVKGAGLALFPEILKSEFHGIRATIEAFSRAGQLAGAEEASACGIRLQQGQPWAERFRVQSEGTVIDYVLDRWD
jgi:hypothetical protein